MSFDLVTAADLFVHLFHLSVKGTSSPSQRRAKAVHNSRWAAWRFICARCWRLDVSPINLNAVHLDRSLKWIIVISNRVLIHLQAWNLILKNIFLSTLALKSSGVCSRKCVSTRSAGEWGHAKADHCSFCSLFSGYSYWLPRLYPQHSIFAVLGGQERNQWVGNTHEGPGISGDRPGLARSHRNCNTGHDQLRCEEDGSKGLEEMEEERECVESKWHRESVKVIHPVVTTGYQKLNYWPVSKVF